MMADLWLQALSLGMMFQGSLILWVGGFPLSLRGRLPRAEKGSPKAFGIFWLEQYRVIGFCLTLMGAGLVVLSLAG